MADERVVERLVASLLWMMTVPSWWDVRWSDTRGVGSIPFIPHGPDGPIMRICYTPYVGVDRMGEVHLSANGDEYRYGYSLPAAW